MKKSWLGRIVFLLPLAAQAQSPLFDRLSFGVTGGVPLQRGANTKSDWYTLGPSVEFAVTRHISLQFNPLYRRLESNVLLFNTTPLADLRQIGVVTFSALRAEEWRTNAWEFPILGKYYVTAPARQWRPFLGAGYSIETGWRNRKITDLTQTVADGSLKLSRSEINDRTRATNGAVTSAGVLWHKGRLGISPEVRYTYRGPRTERVRNQVDFLLQLRF